MYTPKQIWTKYRKRKIGAVCVTFVSLYVFKRLFFVEGGVAPVLIQDWCFDRWMDLIICHVDSF